MHDSDPENLYQILGVDPSANHAQIRKAYIQKARETHADTSKTGGNVDLFIKVREAWLILGNAESKTYYDTFGRSPPKDDEFIVQVSEVYDQLVDAFSKIIDRILSEENEDKAK